MTGSEDDSLRPSASTPLLIISHPCLAKHPLLPGCHRDRYNFDFITFYLQLIDRFFQDVISVMILMLTMAVMMMLMTMMAACFFQNDASSLRDDNKF